MLYVVYFQGHFFNQAKAVKEEIQASNGVLYLIDEVLEVPEGTIYSVLQNPDYNISLFKGLVDLAGFNATLDRTCKLSGDVLKDQNKQFHDLFLFQHELHQHNVAMN